MNKKMLFVSLFIALALSLAFSLFQKAKELKAVADGPLETIITETSFDRSASQKGSISSVTKLISPDGNYKISHEKTIISENFKGRGFTIHELITITCVKDNTKIAEIFSDPKDPIPELSQISNTFSDFSWSADSKTLGYIASGEVHFLDIESGKKTEWSNSKIQCPLVIKYSPDGKYLAVAGYNGQHVWSIPQTVLVLDAKTRTEVWNQEIFTRADLSWSPDGKYLALVTGPKCLQIFDSRSNFKEVLTVADRLRCPVFSPDCKSIAAIGNYKTVKIYDFNGKNTLDAEAIEVRDLLWSPDGKTISYLLSKSAVSRRVNDSAQAENAIQTGSPAPYSIGSVVQTDSALPRYGYMSRAGKTILPTKYFSVHECRDGKLIAGEFDLKNPKGSPTAIKTFDKNGVELTFGLSDDYVACGTIDDLIKIKKNPKKFPSLAEVDLIGLCDKSGKVLLQPQFHWFWSDGKRLLARNSKGLTSMYSMTGIKLSDLGEYMEFNDEFITAENPDRYSFTAHKLDRWIVFDQTGKEIADSKGFVKKIFHSEKALIAKDLYIKVPVNNSKKFFDKNGEYKFSFPAETVYVKESDSDLIPFVVKIYGETKFDDWKYRTGYLGLDGKVVIKPRFMQADAFKKDFAVATASFENGRPNVGVIDKSGKFLVEPKYNDVTITDTGNFIVGKAPDYHFSTADWNSPVEGDSIFVESSFNGLLRDFDLIGRNRKDLYYLLGRPEGMSENESLTAKEVSYTTTKTGCVNEHRWVVFEFDNDKVKRWAFVQGVFRDNSWKPNWNEQNVVFSYEPARTLDWTDHSWGRKDAKPFLKSEVLKR